MSLSDWLRLIILSVLWGGSFPFIEVALIDFDPLTVVNLRLLFAALTLLLIWYWRGSKWTRNSEVWLALVFIALVNNIVPFSLIVWAQTHITASVAAILNATVPIFGVVLAWFFAHDERPGLNKFIGVTLGFVGVVVLLAPSGEELNAATLAGKIAVLLATFCYAVGIIFSKRFKRLGVPPLVLACMQALIAGLMLLPITLMLERPWQVEISSIASPLATIALGVISSALAYLLFFRLLASAGAINLMLVTLLIPVSSCLLAALFLHERLQLNDAIGMLIILSALLVIDGRLPSLVLRKL